MSGFPLLSPLNYPSCSELEKQWDHPDNDLSLKREWNDCVTNNPLAQKNPEWKKLSDKSKQSKINQMCCDEVMQCKNPNGWLLKNNFDVKCNLESTPDQPHFGDVQSHAQTHSNKMKKTMMFGVY